MADGRGLFTGMSDRDVLELAAAHLREAVPLRSWRSWLPRAARERNMFREAMAELDRRKVARELARLTGNGTAGLSRTPGRGC